MLMLTFMLITALAAAFVHGFPIVTSPVPIASDNELGSYDLPIKVAAMAGTIRRFSRAEATAIVSIVAKDSMAAAGVTEVASSLPTSTSAATGPPPEETPDARAGETKHLQARKVAGYAVLLLGALALFLFILFHNRPSIHARRTPSPAARTTRATGTGNAVRSATAQPQRRRSTYNQELPEYLAGAQVLTNLAVPAQHTAAPQYTPTTDQGILPPLYEEPQDLAAAPVESGGIPARALPLPVRHGSHPRPLGGQVVAAAVERRGRFSSW